MLYVSEIVVRLSLFFLSVQLHVSSVVYLMCIKITSCVIVVYWHMQRTIQLHQAGKGMCCLYSPECVTIGDVFLERQHVAYLFLIEVGLNGLRIAEGRGAEGRGGKRRRGEGRGGKGMRLLHE